MILDKGANVLRNVDLGYEPQATWEGVSNAKLNEFQQKIGKWRNRSPIFLYTVNDHSILEDLRVIHFNITSVRYTKLDNEWNSVRLRLDEAIG